MQAKKNGSEGRGFTVRLARPGDLDALQAIEAASFTSAEYLDQKMSRAAMRRHIGSKSADLIVAEACGDAAAGGAADVEKAKKRGTDATNRPLLGYILLFYRKGGKAARVYSIAVDPKAQGMGLGSALLEAGYACAANKNCKSVILEVASENTRLIKLYEGQGFAVTRALPDYYGDGMNGLKMKKDLTRAGTG